MEVIKDEKIIEDLMKKLNYVFDSKNTGTPGIEYVMYNDSVLNKWLSYYDFLDQKETEIMELTGESLSHILYTKYYWQFRFNKRHEELYGEDEGLEQQLSLIIDDIDQRAEDDITLSIKILQEIEEGKV